MRKVDHLDAVGNTHGIMVFFIDNSEHVSESTDGNRIIEEKVHVNKFSWLKVTGVNSGSFGGSFHIFCVTYFHDAWFNFFGQCFGRKVRVSLGCIFS